jgi:hypothetical protein
MSKKSELPKELLDAVKKLLTEASSFEERKAAVDTAMKLEALKLKAKGPDWGKGFDQDVGGDEDGDSF